MFKFIDVRGGFIPKVSGFSKIFSDVFLLESVYKAG